MASSTKLITIAVALLGATAVLFAGDTGLLKLLPSHNTLAGDIDIKAIRKNPQLNRLLISKSAPLAMLNEFDAAAISFDSAGNKVSAACRFASKAALQKYFQAYSPYLLREKDHFTVTGAGRDINGGKIFIAQPDTALFYHDYPAGTTIFNRSGINAETQKLLTVRHPFFARFGGALRSKKEPFRSIRYFNIFLAPDRGKIKLYGMASCRKPMNASLTHVAMLGIFSMWLQEYCGLSPEEAGQMVSLLKVRQHGKNLYFALDDVEKTVQLIIQPRTEKY